MRHSRPTRRRRRQSTAAAAVDTSDEIVRGPSTVVSLTLSRAPAGPLSTLSSACAVVQVSSQYEAESHHSLHAPLDKSQVSHTTRLDATDRQRAHTPPAMPCTPARTDHQRMNERTNEHARCTIEALWLARTPTMDAAMPSRIFALTRRRCCCSPLPPHCLAALSGVLEFRWRDGDDEEHHSSDSLDSGSSRLALERVSARVHQLGDGVQGQIRRWRARRKADCKHGGARWYCC
jgi:hypothetical protein